jgi:hypothetical protein
MLSVGHRRHDFLVELLTKMRRGIGIRRAVCLPVLSGRGLRRCRRSGYNPRTAVSTPQCTSLGFRSPLF